MIARFVAKLALRGHKQEYEVIARGLNLTQLNIDHQCLLYIHNTHTFTSGKFFLGRLLLPFLGTSVDKSFSSRASSFTVSCVVSVVAFAALFSFGATVLGSIIVRTVRAPKNLFSVPCARRVNEILDLALRIVRTVPYDFVIALEFFFRFRQSREERGNFVFLFHSPTRTDTHLKRSSKFTLYLSTTKIIASLASLLSWALR